MEEKVFKIIAKILNVSEEDIKITSDIKNTNNWDSLNHLKLIMGICDEFKIDFDFDILTELTSVRKIINFIKEKNMIEKISSMAIVIANENNKNKVLLLNSEGEWVFPKGHVEKGETEMNAAIRELYEEAGVVVEEKDCLGKVDEFRFFFDGENAVKVIKVFAFKIAQTQKIVYQEEESFIDGQWFDTDVAIGKLKHDDARQALEKTLKLF